MSIRDHLSASPQHWADGRVKNMIFSANNGVWGDNPLGDDSDIHCVRAADFNRDRLRVSGTKWPLRHIGQVDKKKHQLQYGDLILEKSGGGDTQPVGTTVLFDLLEPAVCSNFCARIQPTADTDSRYLNYTFASLYTLGVNKRAIKQTTGLQNLDSNILFSESWKIPPLAEQRRIASFLDAETARIDALVQARRKMAELLKERWSAELDGVIRSTSASMVPLRRYMQWIGQGTSPIAEDRVAEDGEQAVLKLSAVKGGRFISSEQKALPPDFDTSGQLRPELGDLLVTRANTPTLVGDVCCVRSKVHNAILPDFIYKVVLRRSDLLSEYAAYALLTRDARSQISGAARGTSQ